MGAAIATVLFTVAAACGGSGALPPATAPTVFTPTLLSTPSSTSTPAATATLPATATATPGPPTPTTLVVPPSTPTTVPAPRAARVRPIALEGGASQEVAPGLAVASSGSPIDKSHEYLPVRPSGQYRFGEGWAAPPPTSVVIPPAAGGSGQRAGGYYVQDVDGTIHIRVGYWGLSFDSGRRGWSIATGEMQPGSTLTAPLSADPARNFIYEGAGATFVLVDFTGTSVIAGWEARAVINGNWIIVEAQAELPELLDFLDAYLLAN